MVNMLPSVLAPFLPVVWVLVAAVMWWRQLESPVLYVVAALLALFGIQAVIGFLWNWWPALMASGGILVSKVATHEQLQQQLQQHLEEQNRRAVVQAILVLLVAIPFLWWLKAGLSKGT